MPQLGIGDRFVLSVVAVVAAACIFSRLLFLIISAIGSIGMLWYLRRDKSYWRRKGVAQPRVDNLWLGNTIRIAREGLEHVAHSLRRLGPTYGDYNLGRRELVTVDPELLKAIFVQHFENFADAEVAVRNDSKTKSGLLMANMISSITGTQWKRIRALLSTSLTATKMNKAISVFDEVGHSLCRHIERYADANTGVPLEKVMHLAAMDTVARTAFSEDVHAFSCDEDAPFHRRALTFLDELVPVLGCMAAFPFLWDNLRRYLGVDMFYTHSMAFFVAEIEGMYQRRMSNHRSPVDYDDLFQELINATLEINNGDDEGTAGQKKTPISKVELTAQSMMVMAASYKTITTLLQCAVYHLSKLPNVQKRLHREIVEVIGDDVHVTSRHIAGMTYMSQVINETLRIAPPFTRTSRMCNIPITLRGIPFEAGTIAVMPIYAIHHNPDFYEEPEKFDPERFIAERKAARDPMTFVPFGAGPRNCVGSRLGEYSARVILASLVRQYIFEPACGSSDLPLEMMSEHGIILKPLQELRVKVTKRKT